MNKLNVFLRHLWFDESDTRRAIPTDLLKRLAERVAASEQRHSGEIRVCIEAALPTMPCHCAALTCVDKPRSATISIACSANSR